MVKPYSQDLRERVIEAVEGGGGKMSRRAAERHYAISEIRGHQVAGAP